MTNYFDYGVLSPMQEIHSPTLPSHPISARRLVPILAAGLGLLSLAVSSVRAQSYTYTNVVDTTTIAPGQTTAFTSFGTAPTLSGGTVAFAGIYSGGLGIYTGTGGTNANSRVVDSTVTAPGGSGTFNNVASVPVISGSNVGFNGSSNTSNGVYTGTAGTFGASRVADTTLTAPGQATAFTTFGVTSISGSNVAFIGNYSGGAGVYTGTAGTFGASRVIDRSANAPGQTTVFTALSTPTISGSNVAFNGTYSGGSGIYTGTAGATGASRVADTTLTVPGQATAFTSFSPASISGSTVAFRGVYSAGSGIYTGTAGAFGAARLVDLTTTAPGRGVLFTGFGTAVSISGSNVAFTGTYTGGSDLCLLLNGTLVEVIATGSPLFGSTVSSLAISSYSLDVNQIAFRYTLATGVTGMAVASVPEPSTWALMACGAGLLGVTLHRRARWA
jgi:hypothetical protein